MGFGARYGDLSYKMKSGDLIKVVSSHPMLLLKPQRQNGLMGDICVNMIMFLY